MSNQVFHHGIYRCCGDTSVQSSYYKHDISKAYQNQEQIRKMFIQNAFTILSDRCRSYYHMRASNTVISAIGTHDQEIIEEIIKNMGSFNIHRENCDFEFLYFHNFTL